jgi:predicted nucleotidyltransferase
MTSLTQRDEGMRLAEVASAIGSRLSSAQRAVGALVDDGLVEVDLPDRRFRSAEAHPASEAFAEFALRRLPLQRALDIVFRANPAVEFAGSDTRGYLVVVSPYAEPNDVARLQASVERVTRARHDSVPVEIAERSDLRDRLLDDPALRRRGLRLGVVKGSAGRTFRDPFQHGSSGVPALGRLHPSLVVSRRALARLAHRFRLQRLAVFGSAVHADFRPDSDVDVVLEPAPNARLSLADLVELRAELEKLFGRDVDVVTERSLVEPMRSAVRRDAVVLYGSA